MPTRTVILNSNNYNSNGSGNSFIYKFPSAVTMSSLDKIGIQSISLFNSFFNITSALANNLMTIIFPGYTPTGTTAIFNGLIGNSVSFLGSISNPQPLEIYGTTVSSTKTLSGFIGGAKVLIPGCYIFGTSLRVTSGAPVLTLGMYLNGSTTTLISYVSGVYTLSDSNLGNIGSSATPSTTCFACSTGNILYVTSTPSGALTANADNLLIYVSSSYFTSYALNSITMTQSITNYTLNTTATYAPLSNITAGLGSKTFTGTSTAPIYTGMHFTFSNTVYTILSSSSVGSLYTISLDNTAGIFPGSLISNVKIPLLTTSPIFSILTVNSTTSGNGLLQNYVISGLGVSPGLQIISQISSTTTTTNGAGIYKISYNEDLDTRTMSSSDNVTNNNVLTVTDMSKGIIQSGMILRDANNIISTKNIVVGTQISGITGGVGTYSISSSTNDEIPSIYPEEIIGSLNYSNFVTIPIVIPDGYYTITSLNYFLQNIMIQNNLYLTDSTGTNNTYFIELIQNNINYSMQINIFPLPIALSNVQYYPENAEWSLPSYSQTPQLLINENLLSWFGMSQTYPSSNSTTSYYQNYLQLPLSTSILNGVQKSYVSNICPQINTISSIVIRCNLINSIYSNPSDNFVCVPLKNSFGNLISIDYSPIMLNVRGGIENNITLSFYAPDESPINIIDNDITVQLIIEQSNVF